MKKKLLGALMGLIIMLPVSGMAIELTDYLDPDLQFQDAEIQAMFNLKDGNQDQTSFNGSFRIEYDMEYSTLPFKWQVYAKGDTDFSRGGDEDESTDKNSTAEAYTVVQKYLNGYDKVFVYGRLDLGLQDLEDNEDNDPYSRVSAGIGYGRITTATPLPFSPFSIAI